LSCRLGIDGLIKQRLDGTGETFHQRNFDEDQGFFRQHRMEIGKAAPVRREPAAQVGPSFHRVHRLVRDQLLEHRGRRLPIDPAQFEKAAVKPGGKQVFQIRIQQLQRRLVAEIP
jgi:hypothetical protein